MFDAIINCASNGNNVIIPSPGTKKRIVVYGYMLVPDNDVAVTWRSGATTNKSGAMNLLANIPLSCGFSDTRMFACGENESLVLHLSGAVGVRGHLVYALEGVDATT